MTKTKKPKIQEAEKSDFTSIKFHPDLEKFKMEKLDEDTVALMTKRAYDMAGCIRGVAVYLNGKKLPVRIQSCISAFFYLLNSESAAQQLSIIYTVQSKFILEIPS